MLHLLSVVAAPATSPQPGSHLATTATGAANQSLRPHHPDMRLPRNSTSQLPTSPEQGGNKNRERIPAILDVFPSFNS
jgi:hypothetical protein